MPNRIAFDLTRLFLGGLGRTPRGIDRVDLSVARRLFDDPERQDVGLVPTMARMGVVTKDEARAVTTVVERRWHEAAPARHDARGAALRRWLAGDGSTLPPATTPKGHAVPWHLAAMAAHAGAAILRPAARRVPHGAVYLNTGQVLLGAPWCFGWLDARPDIKPVFMLHDLIPLTHPEYSGPLLSRHHGRALANAARRAVALLATSHAAADEIRTALATLGRADMPIHVVPLPVSPSLLAAGEAPPLAGGPPYFVTVGILDQRKNHRLLLNLWRKLVRDRGPAAPKLAIIGARGLRTVGLHDFIARSPGLADAVTVVSGLPSAAMRDVVRGARALLMPSFCEGFGLPLIEAQALGVPVIASDIAAHREVGGPATRYLDPLDGPGWHAAVLTLADDTGASPRPDHAPPQTWARYFADVLPFLETL